MPVVAELTGLGQRLAAENVKWWLERGQCLCVGCCGRHESRAGCQKCGYGLDGARMRCSLREAEAGRTHTHICMHSQLPESTRSFPTKPVSNVREQVTGAAHREIPLVMPGV